MKRVKKEETAVTEMTKVTEFKGLALQLASAPVESEKKEYDDMPWLGFFSQKSTRAREIMTDLPNVEEGDPFLATGGRYYDAKSWKFMSLGEFRYWGSIENINGKWEMTEVSLVPKDGLKANVLCVLLHVPGDKDELPEGLKPAAVSLSTFRSPKIPALDGYLKGVEYTETSEWVQQGTNGAIAATTPPRFRVASTLRVESITSRKGYVYQRATADTATVGMTQLQSVIEWFESERCQADLSRAHALFETKRAELTVMSEKEPQTT